MPTDATLVTLPVLCLLCCFFSKSECCLVIGSDNESGDMTINWLPWSFDISSLWTKEEKKQQRIQRTRCRGIRVHINNILNPRPFSVGTVKIFLCYELCIHISVDKAYIHVFATTYFVLLLVC